MLPDATVHVAPALLLIVAPLAPSPPDSTAPSMMRTPPLLIAPVPLAPQSSEVILPSPIPVS